MRGADDPWTPTLDPSNLPAWHYEAEINLADFLAARPHQHVFRLFANKVVIDADLARQTSIGQLPMDIRIDCNVLKILPARGTTGAPRIDLSGRSVQPGNPGALLGWKSYAATGDGMPGEPGFAGGKLDIRAIDPLMESDLEVFMGGGGGGDGQQGSWGADGGPGDPGADCHASLRQVEENGMTWTMWLPDNLGHASGSGINGGTGGRGGTGGDGGNGGAFRLALDAPVEQTEIPQGGGVALSIMGASISVYNAPGGPGRRGDGGKAGIGGPPGPPRLVWNSARYDPAKGAPGGDYAIEVDGGGPGLGGSAGAPGDEGRPGIAGSVAASGAMGLQTVQAMAEDSRPNGLRIRMHDAISAEIAKIASTRDVPTAVSNLDWIALYAAPGGLDYPDVAARCAALAGLQDPGSARSAAVPAAAFASMRALLTGAVAGTANESSWFAQFAAGARATSASWFEELNLLNGGGGGDGTADFAAGIAAWLASVDPGPGAEMVPLNKIIGDEGAMVDPATADGMATLEAGALEASADSGALAVAGIAALGGIIALQSLFSLAFGSGLTAARQKYQSDLKAWEDAFGDWQREEAARASMDAANAPRLADEIRRRKRRQHWDDEVVVDPEMGRFVAVLDSLEVTDSDYTQQVAVFDGFWMPAITDPALAALYAATTARRLTHIYSINLPVSTNLIQGNWYALSLDIANAAIATPPIDARPVLNSYIRAPAVGGAFVLLGLPPAIIPMLGVAPLDPAVQKAMETLLGLIQVPIAPKTPETDTGQVANVTQAITEVTMVNVGQGTCHTVEGQAGFYALIDVGYGDHYDPPILAELIAWISLNRPIVILSHWDQDHYMLATNYEAATQVTSRRWLASSFIGTNTAKSLAEAIMSNGATLHLAGSRTAMAIKANPLMVPSSEAKWLLRAAGLDIPNLLLASTTGTTSNRNNSAAVAATVTQRPGAAANWAYLMPGDASYRYIPAALKTGLRVIEATHHGSSKSIKDDAIPQFAGGAVGGPIYLSNGRGNRHSHSWIYVDGNYEAAGWSVPHETGTTGLSFRIPVPGPAPAVDAAVDTEIPAPLVS